MKKLILFSLICLASIAARAQESGIKGTWTGKLNVFGNELTLVFHFDGEDCTLDSPDQGIKGFRPNWNAQKLASRLLFPLSMPSMRALIWAILSWERSSNMGSRSR